MNYGISGRRALVMGGSRGLGAASAQALSAEGVEVVTLSRSGACPAAVDGGAKITGRAVDLSDAGALGALYAELAEQNFDILIGNAGGPPPGAAASQTSDSWRAAFEALALPVFGLASALLPGMTARGWGRIVTIGSSGIQAPIPNLALSNAVRGAVAGWSKTLAAEVAANGVTVNMVLPGRIATDRLAELDEAAAKRLGKNVDDVKAASRATIPAGRYGRPEEFAAAVAFLCSGPASYITGSMIRVDGGMIRSL